MAAAENVLYWQRKEVCVIIHFFQNMPAKTNLPPAFIVGCYISLLLKSRGWWKTLCLFPTSWSNSSFISGISCLSLSQLDSVSISRGCPKLPVRQRNVNCHISKSWKCWNETFMAQKSMPLTLLFLQKSSFICNSLPHFFVCQKLQFFSDYFWHFLWDYFLRIGQSGL